MKKHFALVLPLLAGTLLTITSCQKSIDTPSQGEVKGTPLPSFSDYCRIESVWKNPGALDQTFWIIEYDEFENPKFITTPTPGTGQPFRVFKYDHWHRLREYFGDYGNGHFEEWHFYGFDNNGRIGVDTAYFFGRLLDKPTDYLKKTISMIDYDSQGRIIHYGAQTYSYDAAGNLIVPGVTYDHQVSMNRTNDYWMFLLKDYSMNNRVAADSYNYVGYPTAFNSTSPLNWVIGDISRCRIGYGCRPSHYFPR